MGTNKHPFHNIKEMIQLKYLIWMVKFETHFYSGYNLNFSFNSLEISNRHLFYNKKTVSIITIETVSKTVLTYDMVHL